MTEAELLKWVQSAPPKVMQQLSQIALRQTTAFIADLVRNQGREMDRAERETGKRLKPSEIAEALAQAILQTNDSVWGRGGRA